MAGMAGRKHTKETREKMRQAHRKNELAKRPKLAAVGETNCPALSEAQGRKPVSIGRSTVR